jgi:hypothetical protein
MSWFYVQNILLILKLFNSGLASGLQKLLLVLGLRKETLVQLTLSKLYITGTRAKKGTSGTINIVKIIYFLHYGGQNRLEEGYDKIN